MQNLSNKTSRRLVSIFALAALTGCSTVSGPTHKIDSCMVGHQYESINQSLTLFFKANAPETYSVSCQEGRTAAQTTYIAQDAKGNLHPTGALFALEYNKDIQQKIKTSAEKGDESTGKFYKDVSYFFGYYLKSIGGMTLDKIQTYVDELKVQASAPAPKPAPRCGIVSGVIRSCVAEPAKEPMPQ